MADDDDLLSRANSLINADTAAAHGERRNSPRQMRRRRSFLASANPADDAERGARFASRNSEDDDLPLLTDVVAEVEPEPGVDDIAASLRPVLAVELSALIDRQLASALPLLVETAVYEAAMHLRQGIEANVAMAARDFVAQRGQLQLPLEEPASGEAAEPDQEQASRPEQTHDPV